MSRPKTIFCDIDGTLVKHMSPDKAANTSSSMELLNKKKKKINEWDKLGYNIILTTGRRESMREQTVKQLSEVGIVYDQLVMGIGGGDRYVVNDRKLDSERDTAYAVNLKRNTGVSTLKI